jgi:hypothetical protein
LALDVGVSIDPAAAWSLRPSNLSDMEMPVYVKGGLGARRLRVTVLGGTPRQAGVRDGFSGFVRVAE